MLEMGQALPCDMRLIQPQVLQLTEGPPHLFS